MCLLYNDNCLLFAHVPIEMNWNIVYELHMQPPHIYTHTQFDFFPFFSAITFRLDWVNEWSANTCLYYEIACVPLLMRICINVCVCVHGLVAYAYALRSVLVCQQQQWRKERERKVDTLTTPARVGHTTTHSHTQAAKDTLYTIGQIKCNRMTMTLAPPIVWWLPRAHIHYNTNGSNFPHFIYSSI